MARTVITLKGTPHIDEDGAASEAITPGHLVTGVATIALHAVAKGDCPRRFALERDEMGDEISDAYAINDYVKVGAFAPGDRVYTWLASGESVTADGFVESAGNGMMQAYTNGVIIGRALETVTAATDARLRMEVY